MALIDEVRTLVSATEAKTVELAKEIWNYAELPFEEYKSAAALIAALKAEGFAVEEGVAEMPTCFVASYTVGSGKPKIGMLAEYDALSSLSQEAGCAVKKPVVNGAPGHGCGHNLLGAGCFSAAVAIKNYLVNHQKDGTIYFFGCPAEEGAGSKQFMARAGVFDDVDFIYSWHPSTKNGISATCSVAIMGANFIFDGVAAHAGGSPHLGRSALDACELMNVGCNYLREHTIDQARIHYAYSDCGGTAPNVVQAHACIKYEVRAPKVKQMQELFQRVVNVAKGAALMTDTKLTVEITMAFSDYVPNTALAEIANESFMELGAPNWTDGDYALARDILASYDEATAAAIRDEFIEEYGEESLAEIMQKPLDRSIERFEKSKMAYECGSTDVGDVGYVTPTVTLHTATACLGNVGHSWQNTAFSGSAVGMKGMMKAAEVMTLASLKAMDRPEVIARAKAEVLKRNGGKYICPLPDDVKPPVGRY